MMVYKSESFVVGEQAARNYKTGGENSRSRARIAKWKVSLNVAMDATGYHVSFAAVKVKS